MALGLGLILIMATTASAQEYASGAGALERFDADARTAIPVTLKLWLLLLLGTFASSIIFVWKKSVARLALAGILVAMLAGHAFFEMLGLPMLGGAIALWHIICWTPVLLVMIWKRPFLDKEESLTYRIWTTMLVAVILISFVFDFRDAWIYLQHVSQ